MLFSQIITEISLYPDYFQMYESEFSEGKTIAQFANVILVSVIFYHCVLYFFPKSPLNSTVSRLHSNDVHEMVDGPFSALYIV